MDGTRKALIDSLQVAAAGLTLTGAVLYALLRSAYIRFYDAFGLSPEDVGITQGDVVAAAGTGLGLFVIAVLPFMLVCWIVAAGLQTFVKEQNGPDLRRPISLSLLIFVVPLVSLLFNDFIWHAPYIWFTVVAMAAALTAIWSCVWLAAHNGSMVTALLAVGATGAVCYLCAQLFVGQRAEDLAADLLYDGVPNNTTFVFDVRRSPVCVTTTNGARQRLVYLGTGASGRVFYDGVQRVAVAYDEVRSITFTSTCDAQ